MAKRGRPTGTKTEETPVVVVNLSKCPKCGSIKRTSYNHTRAMDYGQIVDGRDYSKVIWRNCKCLDCGQTRIDKTFE